MGHFLRGLAFFCCAFFCCDGAAVLERLVCAGSRTAEPMDLLAIGSAPPLPAFAVPDKRGRLLIPVPRGLLKPGPDLRGAVRVLSVQRAALEHTLDRPRPVEPAAAPGVERGIPPCAHSLSPRSGVLGPARLSHTRRSRSGGRSCGPVKGIVRPACHPIPAARVTAGSRAGADAGPSGRISLRGSRSHGCSTAVVQRGAGCSRTRPVAG